MRGRYLHAALLALTGAAGAQAQELPEVVISAERSSSLLRTTGQWW